MRSCQALVAIAALTCASSGCADARSRFDDFEARRALSGEAGTSGTGGIGGGGGGGGEPACMPPAPGVVHGPALLAMDTVTAPGIALMFWGEIETPEVDGHTGVKYTYRPLDALDRQSEVGEQLMLGPYMIADDGKFDFLTPLSTLDGRANAVLPGVPITSELALHGTICGVDTFYCGKVTGYTTSPFAGPTGGRFAITMLASKSDIPAQPRFGCAESDVAPEL